MREAAAHRAASARALPDAFVAGTAEAAFAARTALTPRRLIWAGVLLLAFAVAFAVSSVRGDSGAATSAALEPPARVAAPAPPALSKAAALPEPPPVVRPEPTVVAAPPATTVPAPVEPPPAAVVPEPAPAPPPRETFDLEG